MGGDLLERKLGPLPVVAWGGLLAVFVVAGLYLKGKQPTATAQQSGGAVSSIQPSSAEMFGTLQDQFSTLASGLASIQSTLQMFQPPAATTPVTPPVTTQPTPSTFTPNWGTNSQYDFTAADWSRVAGYDPHSESWVNDAAARAGWQGQDVQTWANSAEGQARYAAAIALGAQPWEAANAAADPGWTPALATRPSASSTLATGAT